MNSIRRSAKNFAYNYSDAQKMIREVTSNSPGAPTVDQMRRVADNMQNPITFEEIMGIIWKRLNDSGKNWRHVFKSLCVLDFLIKAGNERVAILCRSNLYAIETLRDFQHVEEGRDQGIHIRDKAKQLVALLANGPNVKESVNRNDATRSQQCATVQPVNRPTNAAEEAEQLRLALELSLQDQHKQETQDDEYEIRLQQALEESKRDAEAMKAKSEQLPATFELTGKPKSNVDDLLSLGDINLNSNQPSSSMWQKSIVNDIWSSQSVQQVPPIPSSVIPQSVAPSLILGLDVDPWSNNQSSVQYAPYSNYGSIAPPTESPYGNTNGLRSYIDPYDPLVIKDYDKQNTVNQAQSSKFLGVKSNVDVDSLIQLDNIGSSNPFLTSNIDAKRTPTLNELRAQHQTYPTPPISPFPSSIPNSQIPPISSTNPFASSLY